MPRPTDIAQKATAESRRKGAHAANAKRRELGLSLRERIARQLERRAEEIADQVASALATRDGRQIYESLVAIVHAIREDELTKDLPEIPYEVFLEHANALLERQNRPA